MFDPLTVYNAYTAFVAGLVTSVHCVAMCGPLSCAFAPQPNERVHPAKILSAYHLGKLVAYSVVGAFLGAFGSVIFSVLSSAWLSRLPWMLVLFFLLVAFRLDRWIPKPTWLRGIYAQANRRLQSFSRVTAAATIGLLTPLLPCGPLYIIFGLSLFSGSGWKGAEFALGFGLGTLPLLWLAQTQFFRSRHLMQSKRFRKLQRIVAFIAALVLAWRLRTTLGIEGAENWVCHPF